MKNKQRGFIGIAIIIFIALAVAGGGVYVYNQNKLAQHPSLEDNVTEVQTVTVTNGETTYFDSTSSSIDKTQKTLSVKAATNTSTSIPEAKPTLSLTEFNQNSLRNIFETFGSVSFKDGEYLIKEEADAGIFSTIDIPEGAVLFFKYKFLKQGDGDFFTVRYADPNTKKGLDMYVGEDLELSRSGYVQGQSDILMSFSGKKQIVFTLISRGNANAVLSIKDIKIMTMSDYQAFLLKQ